ncbi:hypothetical protein HDU98_006525 [Podochytrium sp. JEL0797]|nr:hypothetical protein HDU98_006525 [Podochytrium sp. JEL0797]
MSSRRTTRSQVRAKAKATPTSASFAKTPAVKPRKTMRSRSVPHRLGDSSKSSRDVEDLRELIKEKRPVKRSAKPSQAPSTAKKQRVEFNNVDPNKLDATSDSDESVDPLDPSDFEPSLSKRPSKIPASARLFSASKSNPFVIRKSASEPATPFPRHVPASPTSRPSIEDRLGGKPSIEDRLGGKPSWVDRFGWKYTSPALYAATSVTTETPSDATMGQSFYATRDFILPLVTKRGDDANTEEFVTLAKPPVEDQARFNSDMDHVFHAWSRFNTAAIAIQSFYGTSNLPLIANFTNSFSNSLQVYLVIRRMSDFLEPFLDARTYTDPFLAKPFSAFPGKDAIMTEFFSKTRRFLINSWPDFHRAWARLVDCMNLIYMVDGVLFRAKELAVYTSFISQFASSNPHVSFVSFYEAHSTWIEYCNSCPDGSFVRFSSRCGKKDEIFLRFTGVAASSGMSEFHSQSIRSRFAAPVQAIKPPAPRVDDTPNHPPAADTQASTERSKSKNYRSVGYKLVDCTVKDGKNICYRFQTGTCRNSAAKCPYVHCCIVCAKKNPPELQHHSAWDAHPERRVTGEGAASQGFP